MGVQRVPHGGMDHAERSFTRRSLRATRVFSCRARPPCPREAVRTEWACRARRSCQGQVARQAPRCAAWLPGVPGLPGAFLGFGVPLVCSCAAQVTSTLHCSSHCTLPPNLLLALQTAPTVRHAVTYPVFLLHVRRWAPPGKIQRRRPLARVGLLMPQGRRRRGRPPTRWAFRA